jgi:hypothetical protein
MKMPNELTIPEPINPKKVFDDLMKSYKLKGMDLPKEEFER